MQVCQLIRKEFRPIFLASSAFRVDCTNANDLLSTFYRYNNVKKLGNVVERMYVNRVSPWLFDLKPLMEMVQHPSKFRFHLETAIHEADYEHAEIPIRVDRRFLRSAEDLAQVIQTTHASAWKSILDQGVLSIDVTIHFDFSFLIVRICPVCDTDTVAWYQDLMQKNDSSELVVHTTAFKHWVGLSGTLWDVFADPPQSDTGCYCQKDNLAA